jgi:pyruvate,orthophosphate dikinase
MEYTIEDGKLYMLQTRNGKRTAAAALKIAVDLVSEGKRTEEEALLMVEPKLLDSVLHPTFKADAMKKAVLLTKGIDASPGAAVGAVYFTAEEAVAAAQGGNKVILVRQETSPEDIEGMDAAQGILTARGGKTSHAAVVARGMGKCCVSGCTEIKVNEDEKFFTVNGKKFAEGEVISLDGSTGAVYEGAVETQDADLSGYFKTFMDWADKYRTLKVRTNADTPRDAKQAAAFGAEGIGLCRTEHMFFEESRIKAFREMIVSKTVEQREKALAKILPMQQGDFEELYRALGGYPVVIRFLDPPLHEFVPHNDEDIAELAKEMGMSFDELKARLSTLLNLTRCSVTEAAVLP